MCKILCPGLQLSMLGGLVWYFVRVQSRIDCEERSEVISWDNFGLPHSPGCLWKSVFGNNSALPERTSKHAGAFLVVTVTRRYCYLVAGGWGH